jgi:hypothetical protein
MMIKKFFKSASLACAAMSMLLVSCGQAYQANYEVVPLPKEIVTTEKGSFKLSESTKIYYAAGDAVMEKNAQLLAQYIEQSTGLKLQLTTEASDKAIILDTQLSHDNAEAYTLEVSAEGVTINGASAAGCFYGIQTLRKSLPVVYESIAEVQLPPVVINDAPRFGYRGAHFDVSRHFFTVDEVKCFLDMLALHNINRMHWHLTDDQGWRIEIKKYPKLTEVGAYRPETVIGRNTGRYDGTPHQGFYTQDEVRDIIAYAAERHITIVPEIDLPGHMQAALAGYPEFGCTGGPYKVWQDWGVSDNVLCGFDLYIPEDYMVIDASGIVSAKISDGASIVISKAAETGKSVLDYLLERRSDVIEIADKDSFSDVKMTVAKPVNTESEYFKQTDEDGNLKWTASVLPETDSEMCFGNIADGKIAAYEYKYSFGGKEYHVYQILGADSFNGYVFTYTALESEYAEHLDEIKAILTKVDFK